MFSWSSQAEEVLKVRESIPRQVDKKSEGSRGERGLEFSKRKKGQTSFFFFLSTFLSLSHLKHLFLFLFLFLSFFRPRTDDYTTQFKLCERK